MTIDPSKLKPGSIVTVRATVKEYVADESAVFVSFICSASLQHLRLRPSEILSIERPFKVGDRMRRKEWKGLVRVEHVCGDWVWVKFEANPNAVGAIVRAHELTHADEGDAR